MIIISFLGTEVRKQFHLHDVGNSCNRLFEVFLFLVYFKDEIKNKFESLARILCNSSTKALSPPAAHFFSINAHYSTTQILQFSS